MRNLLIFIFFVLALISCKPESNDCDYRFIILNSSNYHLDIIVFYLNSDSIPRDTLFTLNPNDEYKFEYINRFPGNAFGLLADSVYLIFDNTKRIIYKKDDQDPRNILLLDACENEIENEYWYTFRYYITNEDYSNAKFIN